MKMTIRKNTTQTRWSMGLTLGVLVPLLNGCNLDGNTTRYQTTPSSIATSADFTDSVPGLGLGGRFVVTRSPADNDASAYVLRWGTNGQPATLPNGQSNFIASEAIVRSDATTLEIPFSVNSVPEGVDSIIVRTSNAMGEASVGLSVTVDNRLFNPLAPTSKPFSLHFDDSDPSLSVAGSFLFQVYNNTDNDVAYYNIHLADANGCVIAGAPLKRIRRVAGAGVYSYRLNSFDPPLTAKSLVVLAENAYGEAYQDDCSLYTHSTGTNFNYIYPTTTPRYQPRAVYFTAPDSDDTYNFDRTLIIEPSLDERDLSNGYFVQWALSTNSQPCVDPNGQVAYFPKDGQSHSVHFTGPLPANVDSLIVSAGRKCVGSTTNAPAITIRLNNLPSSPTWYMIKNASNGRCIKADDRTPGATTSGLSMTTCNPYDTAQRFTTTSVSMSDSDDFFKISSVKNGGCFEREYWSGTWQLNYTCAEGDHWTEMELTKLNDTDKAAKRMVVRNQVAGAWNYSCAWADTVQSRPTGTWGNCGWGIDMTWYFMPNGNPNKNTFALFNDR